MSAFVLAEPGFEKLAQELVAWGKDRDSTLYFAVNGALDSFDGGEGELEMKAMTLAKKLERANYDAVNNRYDEENGPADNPWMIPDRISRPTWSPIQLLKNLQCLKYQMSEGDVPESEIYKRLEDLIGRIATSIVMRSPEYDAAEWGW